MLIGRLVVALIVAVVATCLVLFVFTYAGLDVANPTTVLIAIGIALVWALFAFVRS